MLGVTALSISMTSPLMAQSGKSDRQLLIHLKNGKTVTYSLDEIESIEFPDTPGTIPAEGSASRERSTLQAAPPSSFSSNQPIGPVRLLAGSSSISGATGPANLFDGNGSTGWSSRPDARFPHEFLVELSQPYMIGMLEFDNATQEGLYPGVSAREVTIIASNGSPSGPWVNVASVTLARGVNHQRFPIAPVTAKWFRLAIRSNYGHPNYTQLMDIRFCQAGDLKRNP